MGIAVIRDIIRGGQREIKFRRGQRIKWAGQNRDENKIRQRKEVSKIGILSRYVGEVPQSHRKDMYYLWGLYGKNISAEHYMKLT